MNDKKNIRRAPVAIVGKSVARRSVARRRQNPLDAEPHAEPLPGTMLVLLSRLHRAERVPLAERVPMVEDEPTAT